MSAKTDTPTWLGAHARVARTLLFVLGLMTLAFLYGAQPGQALEVAGTPIVNLPTDREGPFEELEEEGEYECEELEEEFEEEGASEEECEEFEEDERSGSLPPSECRLRTASARVFTQARDRVSLVIGYTSFSPANVTVDYRLKGGKGSLKLGRTTRHFSKQGVFRITDKLSDSQMAKVKAAMDFEVRIRVPSAPGFCRSYYTRHLDAKRKAHGQVVWFQSK